ncbi:MAG: hypothetical protein D8G53_06925 [Candidatus Saccharimonas sp.]|jgi:hypothetical protein|nr:MAG: hypothetical protein D8G53_06925 [Candidatus Saccharimonas sp.]
MHVFINRDTKVELADNEGGKYKRFKKQICQFGEYVDPNNTSKRMVLDKLFGKRLKENFDNGKYGVVAVPLGHPRNSSELAAWNRGEMVNMELTDDGINAVIEIRDDETAKSIENRNIPDVSMGFEDNYLDKKTGKFVGPLLKHVGLVVDPYIKGMRRFVPLADEVPAVLFSDSQDYEKEDKTMTVKIKNDREFDVEVTYAVDGENKTETVAAGAEIEVPEDQAEAVKQQIADAEAPKDNDKENELSEREKALADREAVLAEKEAAAAKRDAEAKFNKLLSDGKVVPAQKDAFMALSEASSTEIHLSDDETKTVDTLLSEFIEASPKLNLTDEKGTDGEGNGGGDEVQLSEDEQSLTDLGLSEEDLKETKRQEKGE